MKFSKIQKLWSWRVKKRTVCSILDFFPLRFKPMFSIIFLSFLLFSGSFSGFLEGALSTPPLEEWMVRQIHKDLEHFQRKSSLPQADLEEVISNKNYEFLLLVLFSIKNNRVTEKVNLMGPVSIRQNAFKKNLVKLCKKYSLPDLKFIISMHDALGEQYLSEIPVFVMAKDRKNERQILVPDFDALLGRYQVIRYRDVTEWSFPWERKFSRMIWRGSTAQHSMEGDKLITQDNMRDFSRVKLCELSEAYPQLIDAKFTVYAQGGEFIPDLQRFHGSYLSFEKQFQYKYQMLIDGNTCSYSNSGWKFFSNSLVFKEDSDKIQWYYQELKPYEHYVPVKVGLEDLIDKIQWAVKEDAEAKRIAASARNFAISHITVDKDEAYLYHLLIAYSQLNWQ